MVDSTPTPVQEPDVEVYGIRENDPTGTLIDRGNLTDEELSQIGRRMGALSELRDAERKLSQASARHMALNEMDMRALHYLMVCESQGVTVTPSMITKHLKISPPPQPSYSTGLKQEITSTGPRTTRTDGSKILQLIPLPAKQPTRP